MFKTMSTVPSLKFFIGLVNAVKPKGYRSLYSKASMGIDNFVTQQSRVKTQMANMEERFRNKMQENVEEGSKGIIFTEDLKNMLHISEENDVDVVIKMLKRFNQQNKQIRFGNFVFGPVIMRMFHVLNKPNEALECFRMPELEGIFTQSMSYQLLFDLLYENQMYNEILNTLDLIKDRQVEGNRYPKNIVVITLAACYKLNSKASLEFALKLWKDLADVGHIPARRAATFCTGLVLNQGETATALEILSTVKNQNYTTVRNLKVKVFTQLGRIEDAIVLLKSVLNQEKIHTFNRDILDNITSQIKVLGDTSLEKEFDQIMKYFKEQGHISELTLDEQLCSEIVIPPLNKQNQQYQQFSNYPRFNTRPGLSSRN